MTQKAICRAWEKSTGNRSFCVRRCAGKIPPIAGRVCGLTGARVDSPSHHRDAGGAVRNVADVHLGRPIRALAFYSESFIYARLRLPIGKMFPAFLGSQ